MKRHKERSPVFVIAEVQHKTRNQARHSTCRTSSGITDAVRRRAVPFPCLHSSPQGEEEKAWFRPTPHPHPSSGCDRTPPIPATFRQAIMPAMGCGIKPPIGNAGYIGLGYGKGAACAPLYPEPRASGWYPPVSVLDQAVPPRPYCPC